MHLLQISLQTHKPLPRFISVQYRTLNVKTISEDAVNALLKSCSEKPNARIAWVKHPEEGDTPAHFHFVASFTNPVRLSEALTAVYKADPHNYVKPCRNFRASVRYLAHLDNPEKCKIDPASICLAGDWEGVNLQTLFERKGATADLARVCRALAEYLEETDGRLSLPRFAIWLDSHGYNSQRAFNMVRVMGISWNDLREELRDDDFLRSVPSSDTPLPSAGVEGSLCSDGVGRAS